MDSGRKPCEDLWRRTLSQIPTVYGRLVYLAQLRNPNSGEYEHHGLVMMFGEEEAGRAMLESHNRCFAEWLQMGLEQQQADLDLYLSAQPTHRRTLVENWLRLKPYRSLLPLSYTPAEQDLFLADLETLLTLLRNVYASGPQRPDDSPRR